MDQPTVFNNLTALVVKGGGNVTISRSGKITGALKATQSKGTLTLRGTGGDSCFVFNNFGGSSRYVHINGRRVDLNRLDEIAADDQEEGTPKDYRLGVGCEFASISVMGSADLGVIPKNLMAEAASVQVSGSGTVELGDQDFTSLTLTVTGSGDIIGHGTLASTAMMQVTGSGDIMGIHVKGSGMAMVTGSGDIRVTAAKPSRITKTTTGSGSVRVYGKKTLC